MDFWTNKMYRVTLLERESDGPITRRNTIGIIRVSRDSKIGKPKLTYWIYDLLSYKSYPLLAWSDDETMACGVTYAAFLNEYFPKKLGNNAYRAKKLLEIVECLNALGENIVLSGKMAEKDIKRQARVKKR